ncbi:hypothetical protein FZI85_23560 [Mycobacterium sp. CBMA293]|nr:hypothetical protein [Mycolicibacterium sp. CBMA 360]MUL60431.1 hypothetical protein [Mycolicibacterium sp. CBMA 335]MUL72246.1 hypothetical protein [Mycolicibacterium sp. CBMA 311]MUL95353.1 hypothetical protein [Mycolicibacterium sp. CBMA 230]MUM06826.1 hypothetical protein [Mycolicibacterium sp. CBMA 213]MUM13994.1 hypothetical protein [Mycolicibacterium sp. CBMA 293]
MIAPAGLAAAETAQETINRLQSQGYTVTIDKIGSGPMSQCTVTSVRNPQQNTQWVPYVGPGRGMNNGTLLMPQTSRTISVSLDCTNTK